jgi:uncharacterized membrane protein
LYWLPIFPVAAFATASQARYLLHVHPLGLLLIVLAIADLANLVPAFAQFAPAADGALTPAPALAGSAITASDRISMPQITSPRLAGEGRRLTLMGSSTREAALADVQANRVAIVGIAAAVLLAAGLRIVHLTQLSLWLDEGFTALYARQSWSNVLGLDGFYSPHPPLYFALVKAVAVPFSEEVAGRLLSAAAGIAAIPVLAALAWRLLGRRSAVVAAMVLALSPLHFYFSQEARMYALVVLLVALSYLALVSFEAAPSWRWATVYGVSVAAALYTDYSAAFALLPQVIIIAMVLDRHRRAALPLVATCIGAGVAYLPWAPQVIESVRGANDVANRDPYLGVDPSKVPASLMSIVGLAGEGSYFQSTHAMPWNAWSEFRVLMLLALLPVVALGVVALVHRPFAGVVTACLFGSIAVTIWISQISPSFAERTILSATLGWALLIGAAFADRPTRLRTTVALLSLGCSLVLVILSLRVVEAHGSKQRWSDASADVALVSSLPIPIVTYSYADVATTLIDVYQPDTLDDMRVVAIHDGELEPVLSNGHFSSSGLTRADILAGKLEEVLPPSDPANGLLWYVSYPRSSDQEIAAHIEQLGYQRILHRVYADPRYLVSLDLFAQPEVHVGPELAEIGAFSTSDGWMFAPEVASVVSDAEPGERLVVQNESFVPDAATLRLPVAGASLVEFSFQMKTDLGPKAIGVALTCFSASDEALAQNREFFTSPETDAQGWETVRLAELCPQDSAAAQLVLSTYAAGEVEFRNVRAYSQPIDVIPTE